MTEENQNFDIYAGNNVHIIVEVLDENGDPLVVTGETIDWMLKTRPSATASIATKSTTGSGSQIVIVDGPGGIIQINLLPTDSSGLKGHYYHEGLMIATSSNEKVTLFSGWIKIKDSAFD